MHTQNIQLLLFISSFNPQFRVTQKDKFFIAISHTPMEMNGFEQPNFLLTAESATTDCPRDF